MVIKLTSGHLKLAVLLAWLVGGLSTITWLTLIQFFSITYLQIFLPYLLLYSLLVSEELIRGYVTKEPQGPVMEQKVV